MKSCQDLICLSPQVLSHLEGFKCDIQKTEVGFTKITIIFCLLSVQKRENCPVQRYSIPEKIGCGVLLFVCLEEDREGKAGCLKNSLDTET